MPTLLNHEPSRLPIFEPLENIDQDTIDRAFKCVMGGKELKSVTKSATLNNENHPCKLLAKNPEHHRRKSYDTNTPKNTSNR